MQKMKNSYEDKVKTIAAFRRRGDAVKTSVRTGYSNSYISEVLSGLYRNEKIVNSAFKMANARKTASTRSRLVS